MQLPKDWETLLNGTLNLDVFYLKLRQFLQSSPQVIPQKSQIFNVFYRVPVKKVCCVLYGEDPYPRKSSANGIAFWDNEVQSWQDRTVGSSMKNILKALLVAHGLADYSTPIAQCREIALQQGIKEPAALFEHWLQNGVLLVNVALTFTTAAEKKQHFYFWQEFHQALIKALAHLPRPPFFILWGKKAQALEPSILRWLPQPQKILKNAHPTFIHQFLNAQQPRFSPFIEIEQKTGFSWL